jgi:hypothetical protein
MERKMPKKQEIDFTERVLLSLVNDVQELEQSAARIKAQVAAMAKERGIAMPR